MGGHLVTINDAREQAFLTEKFGGSTDYWIGFTDEAVEGTWTWISGERGTYIVEPPYTNTYTNWNLPIEPNNSGGAENYAAMTLNGYWNDLPDSVSLRGIVEIDNDVTAPRVLFVSPADGADSVSTSNPIVATFSEEMNPTTVERSFKLYEQTLRGYTAVRDVTVSVNDEQKLGVLTPATQLKKNTSYKVVVTTGAKDASGNALDQEPTVRGNQSFESTFTTGSF